MGRESEWVCPQACELCGSDAEQHDCAIVLRAQLEQANQDYLNMLQTSEYWRDKVEQVKRERDEITGESLEFQRLLRESQAENRLLLATLNHCASHAGSASPCRDCPAAEKGPIGGCYIQDEDAGFVPLTAAEVERVERLERIRKLALEYRDRGDVWAGDLDAALAEGEEE